MGQTLDGKAVAAAVRREVRDRVARLASAGVVPGLATVLVVAGRRWPNDRMPTSAQARSLLPT